MPRTPAIDIKAMLSFVEAAPMTRAEIARQTGLSRAYVTMLATGERGQHASYSTVQAIKAVHDGIVTRKASPL